MSFEYYAIIATLMFCNIALGWILGTIRDRLARIEQILEELLPVKEEIQKAEIDQRTLDEIRNKAEEIIAKTKRKHKVSVSLKGF